MSVAVARMLGETIVLLLLSAPTPPAEAKAEAKKLFDQAETAFRVGRFEDALDGYTKAYEALPSPDFLFNIAQCHRNLGRYERAIFFFESFLERSQDDEARPAVERLIAELEQRAEEQRAREARPPELSLTTSPTPPPTIETEAPLYERGWFWGVVIGAAVTVGGAVAIGVVASKDGFPDCDTCFDLRGR